MGVSSSGRQSLAYTRPGSTRSSPSKKCCCSDRCGSGRAEASLKERPLEFPRPRLIVVEEVADQQMAADGEPALDRRRRGVGPVVIEVVQDARSDDGERLVEVDMAPGHRVLEDRLGVPDVGGDHSGRVLVAEQRSTVREHERVVVDVDDTDGRVDLVCDLVHVADSRQARAEIDDLTDTSLGKRSGGREGGTSSAWTVADRG